MTYFKLPLALIGILMVVGLGLQFWYWPQLPDQMAIHFDAKGNPNDWMDKRSATLLSAGLITSLPIFFAAISQLMRWLPTSMINVPHRDYWFAPERRDESLRWMTGWMSWFSVAISVFLVSLNHLTFIANRDAQPLSSAWFWGMLGAFMFTTFCMLVITLRRFHKPRSF